MASDGGEEIEGLIKATKSDSGVSGKPLRDAHRRIGELIGKAIREDMGDRGYTVIGLLRSGAFLATGIADELGCPLIQFDDKHDERWHFGPDGFLRDFGEYVEGRTVILADAVINTGESMRKVSEGLAGHASEIVLAANVVQEEYRTDLPLYCLRTSKNKFKGCRVRTQDGNRGPDTGDRLFGLL